MLCTIIRAPTGAPFFAPKIGAGEHRRRRGDILAMPSAADAASSPLMPFFYFDVLQRHSWREARLATVCGLVPLLQRYRIFPLCLLQFAASCESEKKILINEHKKWSRCSSQNGRLTQVRRCRAPLRKGQLQVQIGAIFPSQGRIKKESDPVRCDMILRCMRPP